MELDFHLRVQQILEAAVQRLPDQRVEYLEKACVNDAALLDEVLSLLPHYEQTLEFEPSRGPDWFLPGTTTFDQVQRQAADAGESEDPVPPFCIDQYRCVETLGRGGMGIVYRANHATLHQPFAIKLLRRGLLSSETRWRFAFEAELLRRMKHPGIARIYHVNEVRSVDRTQPYFVMEYIHGQPLIRYANMKTLGVLDRMRLLVEACEAVEYAHRRGIIHRDLKPGNILVDELGRPKILDFGIARIEEFNPAASETNSSGFIGTYDYASPEQKAGHNEHLTPRSDVYSLGLVLHELLTGRLPPLVQGQLRLSLRRIGFEDSPSELTKRRAELLYFLRIILSNALARNPDTRYPSAGELGAAISACATEFDPRSLWDGLRLRIKKLLAPRGIADTSATNRPLNALLRTRIGMSLDTPNHNKSHPKQPDAPALPEAEDSDEVYRLR